MIIVHAVATLYIALNAFSQGGCLHHDLRSSRPTINGMTLMRNISEAAITDPLAVAPVASDVGHSDMDVFDGAPNAPTVMDAGLSGSRPGYFASNTINIFFKLFSFTGPIYDDASGNADPSSSAGVAWSRQRKPAILAMIDRMRCKPRLTPTIPVGAAPPGLQHARFLHSSDDMQANFKKVTKFPDLQYNSNEMILICLPSDARYIADHTPRRPIGRRDECGTELADQVLG